MLLENCNLRELERKDLEMVLTWRNSDRVRLNMRSSERITLEDHLKWFSTLKSDMSKKYMIFECCNRSLGIVNFTDIDRVSRKCTWGFYIGDEGAPKGAGTILGYKGLNYVFEQLQMQKVYGEVYSFNLRSIKLHEKLGFSREGYLDKQAYINGSYQDMVLFAQLNDEWAYSKTNIETIINLM